PSLSSDCRFGVAGEVTGRYPPEGVPNVRDLGVQNVYQTQTKAIESFGVSGYFSFGAFADSVFARATFDWYDTVRWVKGRHSFAVGCSYERARFNQANHLFHNGSYSFTAGKSNSAMAEFRLDSH